MARSVATLRADVTSALATTRLWVGLAIAATAGSHAAAAGEPAQPSDGTSKSTAQVAKASPEDHARIAFFEKNIRPLLIENCVGCHGPKKQRGGLRLDTAASARSGGDSGPAIVPGNLEESLLVGAVRYNDDLKMPPKGKLRADQIANIVTWVKQGAVWSESKTDVAATASAPAKHVWDGVITPEQRRFWSFLPVADPAPPAVKKKDWVRSPIDAFLLSALEAKGLKPAAPASRRDLIRRATFDLTGLPPTPEEVDAFVNDPSPEAFARVVDRLLASPRYGERWGRHWLDLARYADSNGMDENMTHAYAYRYRDYVIDAFNKDKPYDQFTREQIAGDLLKTGDSKVDFERIIATGFLTLGPKMLAEDDPLKMEMDIIDEQIDTLSRTFMAMTLGCARCHDHKFDPIPTADYYSLAGIFKSTKTMENFRVVAQWNVRPLATSDEVAKIDALKKQIEAKNQEIKKTTGEATRKLRDLVYEATPAALLAAEVRLRRPPTSAKPLLDLPVKELPAGTVVIEAESFAKSNLVVERTGWGEGIGVLLNGGKMPNFAEYRVEIPNDGLYQLELRFASEESRPVEVIVDGLHENPAAAGDVTGNWGPSGQRWRPAAMLALRKGKHSLRIERDGYFPHVDKLALAPRPLPAGVALASMVPAEPPQGLSPRLWSVAVDRWTSLLRTAKDDPRSPLRPWFSRDAAGAYKPTGEKSLVAIEAALAKSPRPANARELAVRYRDVLRAAGRNQDPGLKALAVIARDPSGALATPRRPESSFPQATTEALARLKKDIEGLRKQMRDIPSAMAVDERPATDIKIAIRGNHMTLGKLVPRQFLRVIAGENQAPLPKNASGRKELAEWLTKPDHPLTARVMANRIWKWHFGQGIVRSVDNFGRLGDRPDHPELLDWLARRFVDGKWSMKAMHRLIMLSNAYQMSTAYSAESAAVDPENRLLWRFDRRRLEAEEVRDAVLAVAGVLDPAMHGTMITNGDHSYINDTGSVSRNLYDSPRRTIYLPILRSGVYDVLQAFDFADPSVPNGMRDATTVAPQSLMLMNSELVAGATLQLARKLLEHKDWDDARRIDAIYERAFCRPPTRDETSRALDFLARYERSAQTLKLGDAKESRPTLAWRGLCRALLCTNEFLYLE